jgi:serine/threonine protein kinase
MIGSYEVVRQLGEGGMGEVYEVFDKKLERRAALKVVPPDLARNPEVVTRFQREAKAISQLRHPGVVHVFVYGVLPFLRGAPYFIMEYLQGETLRARIQAAAKTPEGRLGMDYLPVLQQVAKALAAVHQRGLVHRDLKPSNIMLVADPDAPRGERAKLLDFGIVKILQEVGVAPVDDIEGQTHRGMILGTPLYMAPEQWKNSRRIDGKTDVYALAVMMFLVLTGRMPFRAPDTPGLCFLHCHKSPPSMDSIDPTLPAALVELVAKMLAKDPKHRPSMDEVAAAIGDIAARPLSLPREPMLPEASVELVIDSAEESGDAFAPRRAGASGEHAPSPAEALPPHLAKLLPASYPHSQTMPVPPPPAAEAPGWEDDHVTTSNLATVAPAAPSGVSLAPPTPTRIPEPSDQSLLVGSQYDLRPVMSGRAWLSTGALIAVVLLVVAVNVLHFSGSRRSAAGDSATPASSVASAPPAASAHSAPPAAAAEVQPKAAFKKNCQHMMPNPACVGGQGLSPQQQTALFGVFMHSDASLCPGDRLVLAGLPDAPRLQVQPKTMARKARTTLLHDLKDLPESLHLPAQVEVLCPDPE